ncbi:hypothetical protein SALBM311S_00468 [Streptomyces alboniger]
MPDLSTVTNGRILYGGDYNPEQWPEETWHEDVRLMRAAGVNSVTLGVFSWAKLEPRPGERDFGWLDRLMDLMHAGGIGVVLATPTASPPPWMGHLHPDTLPVDQDGRTEWWGGRQHFSHSSATYRRYAAAITEDLAARYGDHPGPRPDVAHQQRVLHLRLERRGRRPLPGLVPGAGTKLSTPSTRPGHRLLEPGLRRLGGDALRPATPTT